MQPHRAPRRRRRADHRSSRHRPASVTGDDVAAHHAGDAERARAGARAGAYDALGIVVAFAGAALIAIDGAHGSTGTSTSTTNLAGDALAIVGAIAIALYVIVGRNVGGKVDVRAYSATVSLTAAAFLAIPFALS